MGEMFKRLEVECKAGDTDTVMPLLASFPEFYEKVVFRLREQVSASS
ncbi:MAG: hypothetical protein V7722_02095 [Porticoccus sp.]